MPTWLVILSASSLIVGVVSTIVIIIDISAGHRQMMWIMNLVWPISALYAGPIALAAYFTTGRKMSKKAMEEAKARGNMHGMHDKPFAVSVALGTSHCGSGCALGDLLSESFLVWVPLKLLGREIYAAWVIDYILAFLFGMAFQYFSIAPKRNLSPKEGLVAALKTDTLSLTAWQIGMYGWMAIATFVIFRNSLEKTSPVFWFMMQIAMLCGFVTSYPINWWLIRSGVKEQM